MVSVASTNSGYWPRLLSWCAAGRYRKHDNSIHRQAEGLTAAFGISHPSGGSKARTTRPWPLLSPVGLLTMGRQARRFGGDRTRSGQLTSPARDCQRSKYCSTSGAATVRRSFASSYGRFIRNGEGSNMKKKDFVLLLETFFSAETALVGHRERIAMKR